MSCTGNCCENFRIDNMLTREEFNAKIVVTPTEDSAYIADMLIDIPDDPTHFNCKHFDTATRLCQDYENRPRMCRNYPYGKECERGCGTADLGVDSEKVAACA